MEFVHEEEWVFFLKIGIFCSKFGKKAPTFNWDRAEFRPLRIQKKSLIKQADSF